MTPHHRHIALTLTTITLVASSACTDDSAVNHDHDIITGTIDVHAASIEADPKPPVTATTIQGWLDALLTLVEQLQTADTTLQTDIEALDGRVSTLEQNQGRNPTSSTAAEVSFDDSQTEHKGTTVQTMLEVLDGTITEQDGLLFTQELTTEQHQKDIDKLKTDVWELKDVVIPFSVSSDQILVESSATITKENWAIPPGVPYNGSIHSALQLIWTYAAKVKAMEEQRCPPEMTLVGEAVCVDKKRHSKNTANWQSAALFCNDDDKRLCSPSEFMTFCSYPGKYLDPGEYLDSTTLAVPEWMDQLTGPGYMAFRGSGKNCSTIAAVSATDINYFRCCKPPNPKAPKTF